MMRRFLASLAILGVMVFCGWWFWPYFLSTSAQVSRQQDLLLKEAAHHNWKHVAERMAPDYHDGAGMNKEEALQTARELLEPFLIINFEWSKAVVTVEDKKASVTGTLRMSATGPSGGSMITDRVNQIQQPWTFTWRKDGWDPDSWRLISVSNSEVENSAR